MRWIGKARRDTFFTKDNVSNLNSAFDLCIESEVNKDVINVLMPDNPGRVMDVTPRYAEGRSMKLSIKSDKEFEIYPYMTILYEAGSVR